VGGIGVLDFLNGIGKKFEKLAMKDEFAMAGAVRTSTNRNPILRKFNSLVDEWRGLIFLLMFIWMLAMAYFIIYYDNSVALRSAAFVGADEACAQGYNNLNGFMISNNMVGYCRNLSEINKQQISDALLIQTGHCVNSLWVSFMNFSCRCNSSSDGS
jgi:hypothetical protein